MSASNTRGPVNGPTLDQIHKALVGGFHGMKLSVGKTLTADSSYSSTPSGGRFPYLNFRTGTFSIQPWQDFVQYLSWDIPATLTVQGPGEDGDLTMRRVIMDLIYRTHAIVGLPVDSKGNTVPFSDDTVRQFDRGELKFLADRGAPFLKTGVVQPLDDGLCQAQLVFHVESTLNVDPRTLQLMKVGILGVNAVSPDGLYQDTTATDGRGIALVVAQDEAGWSGYDSQSPSFGSTPSTDYPLLGAAPRKVTGLAPSERVTSVNVTPYTVSLSAGTPTSPLSAIAIYADAHSIYVTSLGTWQSSNTAVATVSASGLVTRVAAGSCTISCLFGGVTSNSVTVTAS